MDALCCAHVRTHEARVLGKRTFRGEGEGAADKKQSPIWGGMGGAKPPIGVYAAEGAAEPSSPFDSENARVRSGGTLLISAAKIAPNSRRFFATIVAIA